MRIITTVATAAVLLAGLQGCGVARRVTTATVNGATGVLSSVGVIDRQPAYVQMQDGSVVEVQR